MQVSVILTKLERREKHAKYEPKGASPFVP